MRLEGIIKTWNDERGFGFITPTQSGPDIFVHATAFRDRTTRPYVGQRITFEVESNSEGKTRARAVEIWGAAPPVPPPPHRTSARPSVAAYSPILGFVVLYLGVTLLWKVPILILGLYIIASIITASVYASDKSAAVEGRWRVSESTLLLLGLIGGWPGAIIAQQLLRHKSSKASFRSAFWGTVILNLLGFLFLTSPLASSLWKK